MTKRMRAFLGAGILAAAALASCGPGGHEHGGPAVDKAAVGEASVKGEVVDMACYMAHEGRGPKHAKCAKACLLEGAPAGILGSDGSLVLLVEDHNAKKPYKAVLELAGRQAEVSGKMVTRGGITALVVASVKEG